MAEHIALFGLVELPGDEGGSLESNVDGGVAVAFEPVGEDAGLGGSARAVGPFDDDEFAFEVFPMNAWGRGAVEFLGGHDQLLHL